MISDGSLALIQLATAGLPVSTALKHYAVMARAAISAGDADALSARADAIRNGLLGIIIANGAVAHPLDARAAAPDIATAFGTLAKSIGDLEAAAATSEPKAALLGAAAMNVVNALTSGDAAEIRAGLATARAATPAPKENTDG